MTSNIENYLTASIDDYLLALADGVHQAQQKLSQIRSPSSKPGEKALSYYLPRLDFELKMAFEVSQVTNDGVTGLSLKARPVGSPSEAQTAVAGAASILKGSFVAVPTDGGKPAVTVSTNLNRLTDRIWEIEVVTANTLGEAQANLPIQFNVDRELSRKINVLEGLDVALRDDTALWFGLLNTNSEGRAVNTLNIDPQEPIGLNIAVILDVAGDTQTLIFKVETPAATTDDQATDTNTSTGDML